MGTDTNTQLQYMHHVDYTSTDAASQLGMPLTTHIMTSISEG